VALTSIEKLGLPMPSAEYIETQFATGANAQAVILNDSSMEPEFRAGDIVVVDPDIEPLPGDYVCACIKASHTYVFRRYKLKPSGNDNAMLIELAPLNPDWPTLTYSTANDLEICGVMTEHTRRGRLSRA
jgi:SOS-response transcriptional repressor LexA